MKRLEIDLPDDVYQYLEIRAAIDDLRIKDGVELLLIELVKQKRRE